MGNFNRLEIIEGRELDLLERSCGAMQGVLEKIAEGRLTKQECVKVAKLGLNLAAQYDAQAKQRAE